MKKQFINPEMEVLRYEEVHALGVAGNSQPAGGAGLSRGKHDDDDDDDF